MDEIKSPYFFEKYQHAPQLATAQSLVGVSLICGQNALICSKEKLLFNACKDSSDSFSVVLSQGSGKSQKSVTFCVTLIWVIIDGETNEKVVQFCRIAGQQNPLLAKKDQRNYIKWYKT